MRGGGGVQVLVSCQQGAHGAAVARAAQRWPRLWLGTASGLRSPAATNQSAPPCHSPPSAGCTSAATWTRRRARGRRSGATACAARRRGRWCAPGGTKPPWPRLRQRGGGAWKRGQGSGGSRWALHRVHLLPPTAECMTGAAAAALGSRVGGWGGGWGTRLWECGHADTKARRSCCWREGVRKVVGRTVVHQANPQAHPGHPPAPATPCQPLSAKRALPPTHTCQPPPPPRRSR